MAEIDPQTAQVEALLAAGDLHAAAVALQARGELSRARELFERVGDWSRAFAIAQAQGDRLLELRLCLRASQSIRARELLQSLAEADRETQEHAAEICERERAWSAAAQLRLALGDLDAALRLYQRAGDLLGVAIVEEQRGQLRAAVQAYRAFLDQRALPLSDAGPADVPADLLKAQRGSARLLLRAGQPDEAIPHLQAARRLLLSSRDEAQRDLLAAVEVELMQAFLAAEEPALAERLFARHARWHAAARSAGSAIEYLRRRAQPVHRAPGSAAAAAADLLLGRYRVGRLLGAGSVGRVYEAEDLYSGRRVALKLLALAGASSSRAAALYERFAREATLLAALRHPKLVQIEQFHPAAGVLALEFMSEGAISDAALPLPLPRLRRVLLDVLDALQAMHAASVLHRDIKPQNLFFDSLGGAKLGDFGIAALKDLGVTQTEGLVGTLAYMAPEQIRGSALSTATDVYGLGVTAYQLATGTLPFPGPDFLTQHVDCAPPDPRGVLPDLPEPWAQLLLRMLHKDPAARGGRLDDLRAVVAKLPVPALAAAPSRLSRPADEPHRPEAASSLMGASPAEDSEPGPCIARTAHSAVFVVADARAGRTVLRERFVPGYFQSPSGIAHLTWLRRMAALAGPGLQRIFAIEIAASDSAAAALAAPPENPATVGGEVVYQYVDPMALVAIADLLPAERAQLDRVLHRLRQAGVVHGSIETAIARQAGHVTLVLHGRHPPAGDAVESASEPQRSAAS